MLHKPPGKPPKLNRICALPGRAERVIEHRPRAISHAPPDRVRTCGPEAFGDQSGVRRIDEIGRSVGNCPIEVENDRGTVNGRPPNSVRLGCQRDTPAAIPFKGGRTEDLRPNRAAFWLIHVRFAHSDYKG
jgi:hypothetical protein